MGKTEEKERSTHMTVVAAKCMSRICCVLGPTVDDGAMQ